MVCALERTAPRGDKSTVLTARILNWRTPFGRLASVLTVATFLGPCGIIPAGGGGIVTSRRIMAPITVQPTVFATVAAPVGPSARPIFQPTAQPTIQPLALGPLTRPDLDLRAGPVDVPLELRIPSLQIVAPVVGVGITAENVMDAPKGPAADPVWQKVFWYRGSGIPGDSGTATFAGHVDDVRGRPAIFSRLKELRSGDLIVVRDTRSGLDIPFAVTAIEAYTVQQAVDPFFLAQIYGSGPVTGRGPQPALDGLAHLTLITCAGGFVNGSYDRRLVVYATRSGSK